jgi:flagellar biosynthesis component FlhA
MVLLELSCGVRRMRRMVMREANWRLTQTGGSHRHESGWRLSKINLTVLAVVVCRLPNWLLFVLLLMVVVLLLLLVMVVMIRAD